MGRPTRDEYFMGIAEAVSRGSTCDRLHVGCVLTLSDHIITTGYNGASSGFPHCDDVGHDIKDGHCVRTIHAEENAVIQAAFYGVSTRGAACYVTANPCIQCTERLFVAGVIHIIYRDRYGSMSERDLEKLAVFTSMGLAIEQMKVDS